MNALILVDIQNDFIPGGSLEVSEGDQIIPVVNRLQGRFDLVVATQDWHPADDLSFASQHEAKNIGEKTKVEGLEQILWPDHCVQETPGAEFVQGLDMKKVEAIIRKGMDRKYDSYSGFFDNGHKKSTGLGDYLKGRDVSEVYLVGLATDVCVKFTALDSRKLGFETHVILNATRGVNLEPGDVDRAIEEMKEAGVRIAQSDDL